MWRPTYFLRVKNRLLIWRTSYDSQQLFKAALKDLRRIKSPKVKVVARRRQPNLLEEDVDGTLHIEVEAELAHQIQVCADHEDKSINEYVLEWLQSGGIQDQYGEIMGQKAVDGSDWRVERE